MESLDYRKNKRKLAHINIHNYDEEFVSICKELVGTACNKVMAVPILVKERLKVKRIDYV